MSSEAVGRENASEQDVLGQAQMALGKVWLDCAERRSANWRDH